MTEFVGGVKKEDVVKAAETDGSGSGLVVFFVRLSVKVYTRT